MIELERERESEEDEEGGGTTDTAPMLPQSLPSRRSTAAQGLRLLLHLLLSGRALAGLLLYLLLPASVFLLVLLPAATTVYVGFLCHSRVHPAPRPACRALLSDRAAAALIVSGFLALPPLVVLAAALRARLARRLRPLLPLPAWTPGRCRWPGAGHPDGEQPQPQLCARPWRDPARAPHRRRDAPRGGTRVPRTGPAGRRPALRAGEEGDGRPPARCPSERAR
ncbi:transmembrane protein 88B [Suncus etruscus]|uniref:transmembrane protein 88B n=1 Tax=Suncus etruscus TaxID=109475 RepID=UPI00210F6186|nr:transmembrane protein 88B [Suncus etruscus]